MSILTALGCQSNQEIMDNFLSIASQFPSKNIIMLSHTYLSKLSLEDMCSIFNFCAMKLKAQPESCLETVLAIVECLSKKRKIDDNTNSNIIIDILENKVLPPCIKLLSSGKSTVRSTCGELLAQLALFATTTGDSNYDMITLGIVTAALTECLVKSTSGSVVTFPIVPLTSADHRKNVYLSISSIFNIIKDFSSQTKSIDDSITSKILEAVVTSLSKESALEAKEAGTCAMIRWMNFHKLQNDQGFTSGYNKALDFCAKPLLDKSHGTGSEFRARLGAIFTLCETLNVAESITLDILEKHEQIAIKSLESIIDAASKKYANSNLMPQIDGLIAVFMLLLNCQGSLKKLSTNASKSLQLGAKSRDKTSFLYSSSMTEACTTDMIVKQLLHRTIALYSKLIGSSRDSMSSEHHYIVCRKESGEFSAAAYAMACTIAHPSSSSFIDTNSEQESLQCVITHAGPADRSADAIVSALFHRVNEISLQREEKATTLLYSRDYRESDEYTLPFHKSNGNSVRTSSLLLVKSVTDAKHFALVLILSHFATTVRAEGRKQRVALEGLVTDYYFTSFREHMDLSVVADMLCELSTSHITKEEPGLPISECIFHSALSTITTIGKLAGNYDEETFDSQDGNSKPFFVSWELCIKQLAPLLASSLSTVMQKIENLSQDDIAIYNLIPGKLYNPKTASDANYGIVNKNRTTDDEEWEMQVKRELEEKKRKKNEVLGKDEEERLIEQELQRGRIENILDRDLSRSLCAIQTLCTSDFEIGNNILPSTAYAVTSAVISKSSVMKMKLFECESVLRSLAACVYELDESISGEIVQALMICQTKTLGEAKEMIQCVPLPHECPCAVNVINSIDEYGECLSVNSFGFVFPIIRAALMGARTAIGSEPALKLLDRHTKLLGMNQTLSSLRKEMSSTVLELLSHDRSISFKDPAPIDVLVHIYTCTEKISTNELSPLLGERGALGGKTSRLAAMTTLTAVLQKNTKLIQTNPLIENRVLVNCFAMDEKINSEARRAWLIGFGSDPTNKVLHAPSKIFAVALIPLLSHNDSDIAVAAAKAFAFAIEQYPDMTRRSFERLFNLYIESYATMSQKNTQTNDKVSVSSTVSGESQKSAPQKKTKLDIGTVKKSAAPKKKNVSAMSMLTKAPATKKKNLKQASALASFAPKKKERTLDQDELISQFTVLKVDDKKNKEVDNEEKIAIRKGVIRAIASLSPNLAIDIHMLKLLVGFLIVFGLADVDQAIRDSARNTLRDLIGSDSAKGAISLLIPLLEVTLKTGEADKSCLGDLPTDKVMDDKDAMFNRKEGVVVALGAAAIHLRDVEDDKKISDTFNMLINALSTPSESVQSSIALCLANLMKKGKLRDTTESLLTDQIHQCLHGKSLASRRGAAYGISAIIKGSGIASLKKYSVIKELEDALTNGSSSSKEGALFAVELLSERLGLLFEPYVIVLLPALLKCFSDSSDHVRVAAKSSIGLIMSKLSGHGVKLLVPAVLAGLDDDDWRTKQASIHMLGSMSHCAPRQLATCLPNIVPKVTDAFSDTHPKVKASAKTSLEDICKVIKNPEISDISSTLLQALTDPSTKTAAALESLIETEFVHAIDAASLSLIVPVIHRGLRDRAATTKRYGALIAGNICTMVDDPKDFVPYLPILLPDLKAVLLDPIPDCRSISAKALGSLARSLGEATFPELRHWLISVLKGEDGTSVERSGAAQGLTELLCASGTEVVQSVMRNEILPLMSHPKSGTREGVLWVLTFLPSSLGHSFAPLIDVSFPALINGLSDENESVRDVAMRAGRVTIRSHGKTHFDKVLPTLEDGLSHADYRIRAASLSLLGDLLATLGGTKMVGGIDTQDDIRQAERAQAQIALILGSDIRKRVLSRLYLRRSDTAAVVRSSAVQVWKSVVSVTPRTLKEILDVLVGQIVTTLASGHPDHTQVAGRCLGEIVSKIGDTVLPEIMPVLRDALYKGDLHTRVGACFGLAEVIEGCTKEQIIKYLHVLVKVVQDALCDSEEDVRKIATSCFQNLFSAVGTKAFDEIVPSLLVEMESTSGSDNSRARALNGVTGILSIRSKELLPYLIPRLLRRPITKNQATALGSICTVTGSSIFSYFSTIVPTFLDELSLTFDKELDETSKSTEDAIRLSIRSLCGSVDEAGIYPLICEIASKCGSDNVGIRKECCWVLQVIIEESEWFFAIKLFSVSF
jgi:HEAT repeat protein